MQRNKSNIVTRKLRPNDEECFCGSAWNERLRYAPLTDQGARADQQDRLFAGSRGEQFLAAVCDGMGGMEGGGRASKLAIEMLKDRFMEDTVPDGRRFFSRMITQIDQAVCRMEEKGIPLQAGTTIAAVIMENNELVWVSVGDSRIYLYRAGRLLCPVSSHTYRAMLDEWLEKGKIGYREYQEEKKRTNVDGLISYLGINGVTKIDMNARPFRTVPGDKILLCSDGLYRSVPDEKIRQLMESGLNTVEKAEYLISAALEAGGNTQDNTSVILIEL